MPYRKTAPVRRYKKKAVPRSRRYVKRRSAVVHLNRDIMPRTKFMMHRWQSPFTVTDTGTGGTLNNCLQIQTNNMYQPYNDVTGTTWTSQKQLSVQMFDYMQQFYDAYTVYKCKIEVECVSQETTNTNMIITVPSEVADQVDRLQKGSDVASRPYAKQILVTPAGGSRSMVKFTRILQLNSLNGYTPLKQYLNDSGNSNATNVSSTPQSQFLNIVFSNASGDTICTSGKMIGQIRVTYYALWRDRQNIVDQANLG